MGHKYADTLSTQSKRNKNKVTETYRKSARFYKVLQGQVSTLDYYSLLARAASIHPQEIKIYQTVLLTNAIASNVQVPILKIFNQWKLFLKSSSIEKIKMLQFNYSTPTYSNKHLSCTTFPVQQLATHSYFFEFPIKKMHLFILSTAESCKEHSKSYSKKTRWMHFLNKNYPQDSKAVCTVLNFSVKKI